MSNLVNISWVNVLTETMVELALWGVYTPTYVLVNILDMLIQGTLTEG
jgi:hypothetical protein